MSTEDITSRMLSAFFTDNKSEIVKDKVSVDDQKRYLERYINTISNEDKIDVGNIIVNNNKRSLLLPCNEGTVVNLDALNDSIINQMYELLLYKKK